jgi:hypothetical protein
LRRNTPVLPRTHATRSIQRFTAINKMPLLPQALYSSNSLLMPHFPALKIER